MYSFFLFSFFSFFTDFLRSSPPSSSSLIFFLENVSLKLHQIHWMISDAVDMDFIKFPLFIQYNVLPDIKNSSSIPDSFALCNMNFLSIFILSGNFGEYLYPISIFTSPLLIFSNEKRERLRIWRVITEPWGFNNP